MTQVEISLCLCVQCMSLILCAVGFSKYQLHDHPVMYSIDPVCKAASNIINIVISNFIDLW
jgi:hypothetical protein